jgi:hypothetical protein
MAVIVIQYEGKLLTRMGIVNSLGMWNQGNQTDGFVKGRSYKGIRAWKRLSGDLRS